MKDKNVAAIFALIFGVFGVHRFYLGQTGLGILYLLFFWTIIPAIVSLIDAIVFFSMDRDEFDYKYNRRYLYPDHHRYDTDFNRRDRRFRREDEYRVDRQRRREEELRRERARRQVNRRRPQSQPKARRTGPDLRKNPYKMSGIKKYKEFDYEAAIEDFKKALSVDPQDIAVHFNLACSYSLTEQKENAFFHLSKAVEFGFVDFKKIQDHDALAFLRIQDEFEIFKRNGYRLNVEPTDPKEEVINANNNLLEQIKQLGELRDKGLLTNEEFEIQKKRLLG